MKSKRLDKAQVAIKNRVEKVYRRRGGFGYCPSSWDKNLWKKPSGDIYDYIEDRFRTTLDTVEYYSAMVFLYKHVANNMLLVEFHDSPQWNEVAQTYHTSETCDHINENKTLLRSKQKSAEANNNNGKGVEMVGTINFDGDMR